MYTAFLNGLLAVGLSDEHTEFFRIHVACDDEHARTLEGIMMSYSGSPNWYGTCLGAMDYALRLRQRFFEQMFDVIQARRMNAVIAGIQSGESLAPKAWLGSDLRYCVNTRGTPLYANVDERLGIDFSVERVPFDTDVFDPRLLRIAPGANTEQHRHPHESIFYVIRGTGRVHVDESVVDIGPGDLVFVPRWATHQSFNTSSDELFILALTDFSLTEKVFIGDHLKTTRRKGTQAPRRGFSRKC
jgi:mannose-6-phosphate isomerase-like protein (cupin superfamily)